jgi:alpha-1,4-digalacturonate transport system substrate-binding protein
MMFPADIPEPDPRSRRSRAVAAIVLAAMASLLAACSASPSSSGSGKFAGKSMTYLYFTNGPDLAATKTLVSRFEQQTGATVALNTIPYSNLTQSLQAQLSAGRPPEVAETTVPQQYGPDLINLSQALGSSWVHSLNPKLLAGAQYHGGAIGLPNQLTVMGPIVNVSMFQKAGVPVPTLNSRWTWPQLVSAAEKVQAANHTTYAIAIDHSGGRLANVVAQYGTFLFGTNGHGTLDSRKAAGAVKQLSQLIASNKISKAAWVAGGENYVAGDTQFLGEQAPVLISGSWEIASLATRAPFKWTAVPNPCSVYCGGGSGGDYMVAFKKSKNPTLAEAFIKFMSEPANQKYMSVQSDTIPSSASLAGPGSVRYPASAAPSMAVFTKAATLMPTAFTLSEANPGYAAATVALLDQVTDVAVGKTTVPKAVAAIAAAAAANSGKS